MAGGVDRPAQPIVEPDFIRKILVWKLVIEFAARVLVRGKLLIAKG